MEILSRLVTAVIENDLWCHLEHVMPLYHVNSGSRLTEEMRAPEGGWACQGASSAKALVGS